MSKIEELVNSKVNASKKEAEKSEDVRFMIMMDYDQREQLRTLAENLGQKQIKFASELFKTALNDAQKVYDDTMAKKNAKQTPAPTTSK